MTTSNKIQAGELFVKISAEYAEFVKGIDKSNDELENLTKVSDNASDEIKDLNKEFDRSADSAKAYQKAVDKVVDSGDDAVRTTGKLTDELKDTRSETKTLNGIVEKLNQHLRTMASKAKKAADETDDLGNKAGGSKAGLDDLNDVLGKFGVTLGISAVIAAIVSIGDFALDAADKATEAMDIIATKTGSAGDELEKYVDIVKGIAMENPYSQEAIANTEATLIRLNRDVDATVLGNLTAEWQAFMALNPDASVEEFDRVFKKWGVSVEDQTGYLNAFNEIAQQTNIDMGTLASALADGDRGYQMMGKSLMDAAAYLGEANYAGELDDAIALASALEMVQAQKAEILGSDEEAAQYVANMWEKAVALGDEGAIVQYLTTTEGIGMRVAGTIAASMTSSAESTEKLVADATNAMGGSLVDLTNEMMTTGEKWEVIWNNMSIAMTPVADCLVNLTDSLVELSQLWNTDNWGKLEVLGRLFTANVWDVILPREDSQKTNPHGEKSTTNNITINQTLNSTTPLDSAKIRQETERGLKVAGKNIFTY